MPVARDTVLGLLDFDSLLSPDELAYRDRVRAFVDRRIRPDIGRWFADAHFPSELIPEFAELDLLGTSLTGYGCPGRSPVEYGLAAMELEAGDSGLRTFVSVQGSLAMSAIHTFGSESQKEQYLPRMARGELLGCFGLTEPTAGSDPAAMLTTAEPTPDGWLLRGTKRWIGLATIAHVAVIWARTPDGIRGFLVPTDTPGFTATAIEDKLSMRASIQCDIVLDDVALPADALLPGTTGLGSALACLGEARYGIAWGVMGAARDSVEAALEYTLEREQFGKPIASFQLVQRKLVDLALEVQKGALLALHLGRLKSKGALTPAQVSVGKLNNVREAIEICREARTLFGGDGVTVEHSPLRHALNLESVRTYEGTDEMHTLVIGQALTGIAAFR
jgi:glutaryl-CoA dehydrogenase